MSLTVFPGFVHIDDVGAAVVDKKDSAVFTIRAFQ